VLGGGRQARLDEPGRRGRDAVHGRKVGADTAVSIMQRHRARGLDYAASGKITLGGTGAAPWDFGEEIFPDHLL
jgi:hypothetical protein